MNTNIDEINLDDLEDVIDNIGYEDESESTHNLSDRETFELYQECLHMIDDFINNDPHLIADPDFFENIHDEISDLIKTQLNVHSPEWFFRSFEKVLYEEELEDIIYHAIDHFFGHILPPRSFENSSIIYDNFDKDIMIKKINELIEIDKNQSSQDTDEWKKDRIYKITASNAYKIFESEAMRNQFIYEK